MRNENSCRSRCRRLEIVGRPADHDRHRALALTFSTALFLVVDLDRPQEGLVNVSQQAMVDLQTRLRGQ